MSSEQILCMSTAATHHNRTEKTSCVSPRLVVCLFLCDDTLHLIHVCALQEISSLPVQLKVSDDDKPLLTLIPLLKEELVEPLFCGYLKRATAIMASADLTAVQLPPLTDDVTELDQSIQLKLANAAQVLLELHNNASVPLKQRLLDAVARNRMFVSLSLKLNCKSLELYGKMVIFYVSV